MHDAWTRGLYFHFRSKIWRHHRVPRPRFLVRRVNFGDSRTFKADIGLLNGILGPLGLKWGFGGQNRGRGGAILFPNELVLPFRGSYVCANFGANRSRNATVRVLADGQTHTLTDANRFYNLSHAICYSYGTDNKIDVVTYFCKLICHFVFSSSRA